MKSTFGTEFTSLKKAVEEAIEEAIECRHYCRSFEMIVTKPTVIYEDSASVVMNSAEPASNLQHESMSLSYQFFREHAATGVTESRDVKSK